MIKRIEMHGKIVFEKDTPAEVRDAVARLFVGCGSLHEEGDNLFWTWGAGDWQEWPRRAGVLLARLQQEGYFPTASDLLGLRPR